MAYKHFLAQCEEIEKAAEPSQSSQNDFKSEVIEAPDLSKSCPVKTNPDESLALNTFNLTSQATTSQEKIGFFSFINLSATCDQADVGDFKLLKLLNVANRLWVTIMLVTDVGDQMC